MDKWKWCLEDDAGKVIKGWKQEEGKWYHLSEDDGVMDTGWFEDPQDKNWYYLGSDGAMCTGWLQLEDIWYYLEPEANGAQGACYTNRSAVINGKPYVFDKDGHMVTSCGDVSKALFNFIKYFEGIYYEAYYCPSHVLTIGIGCTNPKWTSLGEITDAQAFEAWGEDMTVFSDGVDNLAAANGVDLTAYQRDALISFSFNVGLGALSSSTLWKNICAGNLDPGTITENFSRWNKGSDGDVLPGLVRRRSAEANLFLTGSYETN